MQNAINRITLDVHKAVSQVSLVWKRGDTARTIEAILYDNGKPFQLDGCTVSFTTVGDDTMLHICKVEDDRIIYDVAPIVTETPRTFLCEFRVVGGDGEVLTAPRFTIEVRDTVIDPDEVVETEKGAIGTLDALVSEATGVINGANDLINEVETKLENGEFNGKDGAPGKDGQDGYTPKKNKDYFDGKDGVDGKDGAAGADGKSAYQYAIEAGYTDSEEQFADDLANVGNASGGGSDVDFSKMEVISSLDNRDAFIVYDIPEGKPKRILWERLHPLIKDKLNGIVTATALTDEAGTGYVATIPELEDDAVIALVGDIPTKLSELAEDTAHRTVSDAEVSAWNAKSDFSGKFADLEGKPTIPTKTSQLTNDSGFLTQHQSLSGYAKTADHYTKTEADGKYQTKGNYLTSVPSEYVTETELANKKYLTSVPSEYITETELNAKGYLTQHQDLSAYAKKTEIPTVPTKISVFNNDAGYLVKTSLSLGIASDGLIYLFVNGEPVGTGIPQGQSGDVFGYVDENNTVVLNGNLADGTYSVKYEMEDGRTINIGNMVLDSNVYYSITKNLTNCSISNNATQAIKGNSYSATITANSGYELKSVTVTMGGQAVSVSGGVINIANVTGIIVITAVAEESKPAYTNFADSTSADWAVDSRLSSSGTAKNDSPGNYVTNFIGAVKSGDIVVIENFALNGNAGGYTSSKALTSVGSTPLANHTAQSQASDISVTSTGAQFTVGSFASIQNGYFRFAGKPTSTVNDITIKIKRNGQWL